jgi:hypothetical protein
MFSFIWESRSEKDDQIVERAGLRVCRLLFGEVRYGELASEEVCLSIKAKAC